MKILLFKSSGFIQGEHQDLLLWVQFAGSDLSLVAANGI